MLLKHRAGNEHRRAVRALSPRNRLRRSFGSKETRSRDTSISQRSASNRLPAVSRASGMPCNDARPASEAASGAVIADSPAETDRHRQTHGENGINGDAGRVPPECVRLGGLCGQSLGGLGSFLRAAWRSSSAEKSRREASSIRSKSLEFLPRPTGGGASLSASGDWESATSEPLIACGASAEDVEPTGSAAWTGNRAENRVAAQPGSKESNESHRQPASEFKPADGTLQYARPARAMPVVSQPRGEKQRKSLSCVVGPT